ncbi:protein-disulfide reductase DsbD domain-containing protein [uncultured Paracoccus sp.]|uniref:protein-disulfide reductase DsbD domain-containing protein n=1 Tax=uncultured Paracoccus sp. TaxID=189685 RepID=UPI0025F2B62C|nr:protein-disulfide reductase DsbD domain-containing protein [uncultured Paracoccus sp.]
MIRSILILSSCLCLPALPLAAQPPIPGLSGIRILPGWTQPDGSRIAAIEFRLEPGWKTYWRNPGDSGLPPVFDWSGSGNLQGVTLHWPAPQAIPSDDGTALGYHDRLVLPFTAIPVDGDGTVDLAVTVDFGLCKNICVPAHAVLTADAPGTNPDPAILAAMDQVPRTIPGQPGCAVQPIADGMRVTATLPRPVTLAAMELPDAGIWTSTGELRMDGGITTLTADFVPPQAAPFDLPRDRLIFTLVDDQGAVEMRGCDG